MTQLEVRMVFRAEPAAVFSAVSDHERMFSGPLIRACRLTQTGTPDRNGLGAVREIHTLGLHFVEEIVAFDAPHSYEYRIRTVNVPAVHEFGRLDFLPCAEGTEIVWQTRYQFRGSARVSAALGAITAPGFRFVFTHLLHRLRAAMGAQPL